MIGSTISHYRVLAELGRGGMGVVYRAVDTRLGREVALKFLPAHVAESPTGLTRFRREARAASALNHPNICTIYDIGEHEGQHYIAMELLRGQSLSDRIHGGPMPAAEVCRIGAQLAGALEAAHAQGVIHRDVKPGNVFLTERGDAKLLDFGLAKAAPQSDSSETGVTLEPDLTQERRVVGTPSFMSPEQVLGRTVDARTDLFSLGSVLYCMATGRKPFEGPSLHELLESVVRHDPQPVNEVNAKMPPGLAGVIARAMAKAPAMRYPAARDLRADLERLERGEKPVGARATVGRPRLAKIAALVAAIVVLGLIAAAIFYFRGRGGDAEDVAVSPGPVVAVLPFSNQTGDPSRDYLGQALAAGLLTELGEIRALRMVSPGLLGSNRESAVAKAQDLGAEIFVDGDVRAAAGNDLRIAARVTDARSGLVLWSQSFDGGAAELLVLEGRIARGLAGFLALTISPRELDRLAEAPTASLEAMRLYAEGMLLLEGPVEGQGRERAIQSFEAATSLDPRFAVAYAALAEAFWMAHEDSSDPALLDRAVKAAERAVELDPELPQSQLALALVKGSAGDGELDVASILARHPRPAAAHRDLGHLYERAGRLDRAESEFREATKEDPDDWFNWNTLGVFLFRHRDLEVARRAYDRAIALAPPGVTRPRENLAALEVQASRFDQAIELLEALPRGNSDGTTANNLATAYYFSSRADKWEKAEKHYLEAVARDPRRSGFRGNLADLYAATGRSAAALAEYRTAMSLASDEARTRDGDPSARLLVALYGAKAQECLAAVELARYVEEEVSSSSQLLHQVALVYSLCRERAPAIKTLRAAIELGFEPSFAAKEEEFRWLVGDAEFDALTRTPQ